jgi:Rieske Fe-S protein
MNSACLLATAVTLVSTACGAATTATATTSASRSNNVNMISVSAEASAKVVIEVRNRNWNNATVFLNGRQLGLVNGPNGDQLFVLSQSDVTDGIVNLKAHFVGGEDFVARTVRLRRDSKVLLVLNAMAASSDVFEQ